MLETPRLVLRRWKEADLAPFTAMNADPEVMRYFPHGLSPAESLEAFHRMGAHFDRYGFGPFAAELRETGAWAGLLGLNVPTFEAPFTPCVEIGWRLARQFWNRGLATEGASCVLDYAFNQLALSEIVAFTVPSNLPSRRVMEKLGMRRDPAGDFDHPRIAEAHPFRRHVLYRIRNHG